LHHFLTEATWSAEKINERRLEVMNQCNQTRISRGFSLIVDADRTSFLKDLEERKLNYIGGIAKNRNILVKSKSNKLEKIRIDEYAIGDILRGI
jgi:SRSO17 transposase